MNKRQRKKATKRAIENSPWVVITPSVYRVVLKNGKIRNRKLTPTLRCRKVLGLSPKYLARLRSRGVYLLDVDDPNYKNIKLPPYMDSPVYPAPLRAGSWYNGLSAGSGYLGGLCL